MEQAFWAAALDNVQVNGQGVQLAAKQAALDSGTSVIAMTTADAAAVNAVRQPSPPQRTAFICSWPKAQASTS